jgi:small multidrug resistance pump
MVYWIVLYAAIVFEVAGTTSMKLSNGFTRLWPTLFALDFYLLALVGLGFALRKLEMGAAYAIWSGLGTMVVAVIGFVYFDDELTPLKIASLLLVVAGVVGLNISGAGH